VVDKQALNSEGFALGTSTGGLPRQIYYAPDGTMKGCVPGYTSDSQGNKHDRLLMQGYTLTPPEHPKPHCTGCDKWHDTQAEVNACIKAKKVELVKWEKRARKELPQNGEVDDLKKEVSELRDMLKQLLEKK